MARLRRVSPRMAGFTRRRRGRGFSYHDPDGALLPDDEVERIRSLAIPPAWQDVWVCPYPNGHLQATGTDDAGRRQYLYHPQWRARRDRSKFDRVASAAVSLPQARRQIATDLALPGMPLERAAATAVRMLDVGYFRIGNDAYADAHGSFGLTTLERRHVRRHHDSLVFSFTGKSGIAHTVVVTDPDAIEALEVMRRRRTDSAKLLAAKPGRSWCDMTSAQVNSYLSNLFGGQLTAKDFRTWHAGIIAAEALAMTDEPGDTEASRKRAVQQAVAEVAGYLGNTPAVARSSYIDPRIIDLFHEGQTIADAANKRYRTAQARRNALERAVLELLGVAE